MVSPWVSTLCVLLEAVKEGHTDFVVYEPMRSSIMRAIYSSNNFEIVWTVLHTLGEWVTVGFAGVVFRERCWIID
jgi:hypothetical protein